MQIDVNHLLVAGIWLLYGGGLLSLKQAGQGVAYLGPGAVRVRFPSWRAAFGGKLALLVNPLRAFWPVADVELFAPSRKGAYAELEASASKLARSMRYGRPLLMASSLVVVLLIPGWILLRGADWIFLGLVGLSYLLYLATIAVLVKTGLLSGTHQKRAGWKMLLEPLLCIPYAPHLFRKLSASRGLSIPLIDLLQAGKPLDGADLRDLLAHLREHQEMTEHAGELAQLAQLASLIEKKLSEIPE